MTSATSPAVRHVGCPACGATLAFREGQRTAPCAACGGRALLRLGDGIARERVAANLDAAAAIARVRRAWSEGPVDPDLAAAARFDVPEAFLAPLWEVEAVRAGLVERDLGVMSVRSGHMLRDADGKARYVDDAGREIPVHEYYLRRERPVRDTRVHLLADARSGPAGGPAEWRLEAFDVAALRADPSVTFTPWSHDDAARDASVLPVRVAATEAARTTGGIANDLHLLGAEVRYVYVPLWVVRCRAAGRTYTYVIDAVQGRILAGRAPEAPRRGALVGGLAAAAIGFVAGKIAATIVASPSGVAGLVVALDPGLLLWVGLAATVALFFPLSVGWAEYRYRGEVDFGPSGARVVKLGRPRDTWVEKLMGRVFDAINRAWYQDADDPWRRL